MQRFPAEFGLTVSPSSSHLSSLLFLPPTQSQHWQSGREAGSSLPRSLPLSLSRFPQAGNNGSAFEQHALWEKKYILLDPWLAQEDFRKYWGGGSQLGTAKGHERRERTGKCRPVRLKGGGSLLADELDACSRGAADPVGKD